MGVIYPILSLILLSTAAVSGKITDEFYNSLRNLNQVMDFVEVKYEWAGEFVVESDNGKDIVMAEPHNVFTFKSCLMALTENRLAHQKVIFDIDSPQVLERIALMFDKRHDFVILLLRSMLGPNGKVPKFDNALQLATLLSRLRLHNVVKIGLGYTSTIYGPLKSYNIIHFAQIKTHLLHNSISSRVVLLDLDVVMISNTEIDALGDEVLNFEFILLRTENEMLDSYVNVEKIKMFVGLGTGNKLVLSVTDSLRFKILDGGVDSMRMKNGGVIWVAAIAIWWMMNKM